MPRQQLNVRVAPYTRQQVDEIKTATGMSEGEVVALALDHFYASKYMQLARLHIDHRIGDTPNDDGNRTIHIYVWGMGEPETDEALHLYWDKFDNYVLRMRQDRVFCEYGDSFKAHVGTPPPDWTPDEA